MKLSLMGKLMPPLRLSFAGLVACIASLTLVACNETTAPAAMTSAPPGATQSSFRMPEEPGCGGDIARLRALIDNDVQAGHLNRSVYERMTGDLERAAAACSAGRDAEAGRVVRTTKARYGYP